MVERIDINARWETVTQRTLDFPVDLGSCCNKAARQSFPLAPQFCARLLYIINVKRITELEALV